LSNLYKNPFHLVDWKSVLQTFCVVKANNYYSFQPLSFQKYCPNIQKRSDSCFQQNILTRMRVFIKIVKATCLLYRSRGVFLYFAPHKFQALIRLKEGLTNGVCVEL